MLSHEQILSLTLNNALTELNKHPDKYYSKLNNEWRIYMDKLMDKDWIFYDFGTSYFVQWYSSNNKWDKVLK